MLAYQQLAHLLKRSKLKKSGLIVGIALVLIDAASAVGFPYLTQLIVDQFSAQGIVWDLVWALIIVLVVGSIAQGGASYVLGKLGLQFVHNTRTRLHHHLIRLPVVEFDKTRAAEPAGRLVSDTTVISGLLSEQVIVFISGVTTLVASLVILWFIDAVLTAVLFACVLGAFLMILPLAAGLTKLSTQLQAGEANFIARLSEVFSNIRLLKSAGAEKQEDGLALLEIDYLFAKQLKETKIYAFFGPVVSLAISVSMVVILVVGASRVADGSLTMGALIAFILYLFNIVMPLAGLSAFVAELNKSAGAAQRICELEALALEKTSGGEVKIHNQPIVFTDLRFSYDGEQQPALEISHLTLPANSVTAVVGRSGSGKSTLFSLLNRFYPSSGISVNQVPIEDISLPYWRSQIATVAQNAPVLAGTVRFNLGYGMPEHPSDQAMIAALQDAQLWDFLSNQNGLDTKIDELGTNISGGQRQRLSIASAILRDPSLLILDEATSALDSGTEKAVNQALSTLQSQRTCLIAAHRLNTVIHADQIVVLNKGQVVDVGQHDQLLTRCRHYQKLVEQQLLSDRASDAS